MLVAVIDKEPDYRLEVATLIQRIELGVIAGDLGSLHGDDLTRLVTLVENLEQDPSRAGILDELSVGDFLARRTLLGTLIKAMRDPSLYGCARIVESEKIVRSGEVVGTRYSVECYIDPPKPTIDQGGDG